MRVLLFLILISFSLSNTATHDPIWITFFQQPIPAIQSNPSKSLMINSTSTKQKQVKPTNKVSGANNYIEGQYNEMTGESNLIKGSFNNLRGGVNKISGLGNQILGIKNNVNGHVNYVNGLRNKIDGVNNQISGNKNNVNGHKNGISGTNNYVSGSGNKVEGTGNVVGDSLNLRKLISEMNQKFASRFDFYRTSSGLGQRKAQSSYRKLNSSQNP